jgi:hypothetical protein
MTRATRARYVIDKMQFSFRCRVNFSKKLNSRHMTVEGLSHGVHSFNHCISQKEENIIMSEMIAYCGLDCSECKAFKATQKKDFERKKEIAKQWTEGLNVAFKPEDINCKGCKSDTLSGWCRKICKIRPCAEEKKMKTCAHCDDYPCGKLKEFLSDEPVATENLAKIRKMLEAQ